MALSFKDLCAQALESIGGFAAPTTIINNTDDDAKILKHAAIQTGRELARRYKWNALLTPTSFTTVSGTTLYDRPSDFKQFANLTFWNETEARPLIGPYTPIAWAELTRGINVNGYTYTFRQIGNQIEISPSPPNGQTIGYDYYSYAYCQDSGGTPLEAWSSDTDTSRLDEDLFTLGIRYRFLQRQELPYEEDKADYLDAINSALFNDGPKGVSNLAGPPSPRYDNFPDQSFG